MNLSQIGMVAVLTALVAVNANADVGRGDRYSGHAWASRSPVLAQHGMAATEQPLASQIAVDILKKGGSAVDAAIAANAALGLMEPVLNGIGGDCFVIVWDPKTHKLYGYNGSGPSAKGRDLAKMQAEVKAAYLKAGLPATAHIPPVGSLPITVPGTVDAWGALHDKFGKLSLADDLAPAIAYAKNGFPVTQLVAQYWKGSMAKFEREHGLIEESANARHTYLIDGHTPAEGEVFRNPDLARTLTLIAEGGRDAFYKGAIAHTIDSYFKRIGGDLRYADFADYHGEWVTPQSVELPRLRRLRTAAERPGFRRAGDAAAAQGLRPEEDGRGQRRCDHRDAGSQAPGLRRPGEILCRPALRRRADEGPAVRGVCRRSGAS